MQKSQSLSLDAVGMKKYKNMEINNMNEIKRKMNERISDSMAFKNMKGLKENLKNAESINAYYIYMHDMDKTNARLEERRNKAKKIEWIIYTIVLLIKKLIIYLMIKRT